jgi:hypothetical protein
MPSGLVLTTAPLEESKIKHATAAAKLAWRLLNILLLVLETCRKASSI